MSLTARDIVTGALRKLTVLGSGDALPASDAQDALTALNLMLETWSTDNLIIPNKVREVFPLVSGKQSYTMGTGGDLNSDRPLEIEIALLQYPNQTQTIEVPIEIVTEEEFASILVKTLNSTIPQVLYAEGTYPLETVNLWPIPSSAYNIVLYSQKQLAQLSNLSTALSLPPGYSEAMIYNLAVRLAPDYGKQVGADVVALAANLKASIKRQNIKPLYLKVDDALLSRPGVFDWRTGGFN